MVAIKYKFPLNRYSILNIAWALITLTVTFSTRLSLKCYMVQKTFDLLESLQVSLEYSIVKPA